MHDLVLIGGGEHARVVAEAATRSGAYRLIGFVDPWEQPAAAAMGLIRLGDDDVLPRYRQAHLHLAFGATGPAHRRRALAASFASEQFHFATIMHPQAIVSPTAQIGAGSFIGAGAIVQTGAVIGQHVIVNSGVIVEHDVQVGDHAQLAPRVVIGGATQIGAGTFVGLGAAIRDHLRIGVDVTIGMGAVVVGDVPAHATAMGIPARIPQHYASSVEGQHP